LKILQGNPGKRHVDPAAEPQPSRGIPPMPAWLEPFPVAAAEWARESAELDRMGVMTTADAGTLAARCYVASQIQALAKRLKSRGRVVNGERGPKSSPAAVQLTALLTEYRQLGSLLGLDPSSRSRIHVEPQKPVSKFDGLIGGKKA
jgi:P27 family predicted phage terminase small subunit